MFDDDRGQGLVNAGLRLLAMGHVCNGAADMNDLSTAQRLALTERGYLTVGGVALTERGALQVACECKLVAGEILLERTGSDG